MPDYTPKPIACAILFVLLYNTLAPAVAGPAAGSRVAILSAEINKAPGDQSLYLRRALAWADAGQPGEAMADVDRAEQSGDPVEAALVRGILLYRLQQPSEARQAFDAYLRHHPEDQRALEYRAQLLRDSGDSRAALEDYQTLLRLQPEQGAGAYLATASLMATLPEEGIPSALALLDKRIDQVGAIPQLQRNAIALEKQQGNYAGALQRLSTLEPAIKATPEWHVEVAELLLLSADPVQASSHLLVATEQLQALRPTPARAKTQERVLALMDLVESTTP